MAFPDTPAPTNRNDTTPVIDVLYDDDTIDTNTPPASGSTTSNEEPGTMFWAN